MTTHEESEIIFAPFNPPEGHFQYILNTLLSIGSAVCDEIRTFQPDFVVILLHGGWSVYHAANAIWQQTETVSFPPIFPINLGREKEQRYTAHRNTLPFSRHGIFVGTFSDHEEVGYFLNWVAQQNDWIEWIRARACQQGFSYEQVRRILIVDDGTFEGTTFFLGQQLFESSFPQAEVRFIADTGFEWRSRLSDPWIEQHQVVLREDPTRATGHAIWQLATGSADIDPESLDWQPLHTGLPELQPLAEYLPLETWLELPGWIRSQIELAALQWVKDPPSNGGAFRSCRVKFSHSNLLFRYIWKCGSINSAELSQISGLSLRKARKELRFFYEHGCLILRGTGQHRRYRIPPSYDLHNVADEEQENFFWVLPGRLLAGHNPEWTRKDENGQSILAPLLSAGLDCLVELVGEGPGTRIQPDELGIGYHSITIPKNRYDETWIRDTLGVLENQLRQYKMVYLTDPITPVLGLILGCFLVQQGMTGPAALRYLRRASQKYREPWRPFPGDLRVRKIIKRWRAAESPSELLPPVQAGKPRFNSR